MSKIKILEQNLINQIAAGEVIERPASVVKELVENSLDAGATNIVIETKSGGKKLIKVTDNGSGMSKEDLPLALERHATSKIASPADLFKITTMGFRGEALPSIASISKMNIISKQKKISENNGYKLQLEASKVLGVEAVACTDGTAIEVYDLFYNLPARLKFLKGDSTELGHIQSFISRIILARADVSFTFINDNKIILQTQGIVGDPERSLTNAVAAVFGGKVARALRKIALDFEDFTVSGFVSEPTVLSSNRNGQIFFVNNRNIFSPILNKAADTAVSDLIPRGKYPYLVLFIDMAYDQVDVNVHPAKREVRFADSGKVFDAVRSAIRNAYARVVCSEQKQFSEMVKATPFLNHKSNVHVSPIELNYASPKEQMIAKTVKDVIADQYSYQPDFSAKSNFYVVLGQANKMFIIVLDGEDLLLIDQHAAHERIIYESLKNNQQQHNQQVLLIPENIELGQEQLGVLAVRGAILKELGFDWEKFSETSVVLRAVPNLKTKLSLQTIFMELVEELDETGSKNAIDKVKEKLLATIACKGAVKAGDILDVSEMKQLVKDLFATPHYQTCPHGRPTISAFSQEELAKRFNR